MKKVMHMVTCFGAATVILGALFKIMHYPGASIMLPMGLIVETFLFIFFGFDIPHEEVDWTLAYPELAGMGHDETFIKRRKMTRIFRLLRSSTTFLLMPRSVLS